MNKNKVFYIIYRNVSNKHPSWSNKRVRATTVWCLKKHTRQSD